MSEIYLVLTIVIATVINWSFKKNLNPIAVGLTPERSVCLKACAALLIIGGHCVIASKGIDVDLLDVGWYCVAVFFFLSGWGCAWGYNNKHGYMKFFIKNRLIKLIIPFVVAHIIYFVIKVACGTSFTLIDIAMGMLGQMTVVDNSWYPVAILIFYLSFWLIYRFIKNKRLRLITLFLVVWAVTVAETFIFNGATNWYISNLAFFVGCALQELEIKFERFVQIAVCAIIAFFIAYALIPAFHIIFGYYNDYVYVLASNLKSASLAVFSASVVARFGKPNRVMLFLGKISYEIYLYHGLFIFLLSRFVTTNVWLLIALTLIFTIPFSWIMNKLDVKTIGLLLRNKK